MQAKYLFGDIIVYKDYLIGVVLKTWYNPKGYYTYDVYIRNYNKIVTVYEEEIVRYRVRHKELNREEIMYQNSND